MDFDSVAVGIGVLGIVVPILVVHERRLTRIEGKIDALMEMLRSALKK